MKAYLKETTITSKATWAVFALAVLFADVMYLQLVWSVVDGLLAILALGGAFALGASVLMLPLKLKNGDIDGGNQRTIAITVLMFEFGLMILNTVVAFAEAAGDMTDQFLTIYATYVAPATPILVAAGFLLIWLFDPIDQAERAKQMARTTEEVTKAEIETNLRLATLEGVRRNIDSAAYKQYVDKEIQRRTFEMLRETFGALEDGSNGLPAPATITMTMSPAAPQLAPGSPASSHWTLEQLLEAIGVNSKQAAQALLKRYGLTTATKAYEQLKAFNRLPANLDQASFSVFYTELMSTETQPAEPMLAEALNGDFPNATGQ